MTKHDRVTSVYLYVSEVTAPGTLYGLYDTLSSVGLGWELFITGEEPSPRFDVKVVSATGEPLRLFNGATLCPDVGIASVAPPDVIIVPGILASSLERKAPPDAASGEWMLDMQRGGARLASACTGALELAELGVLDGLEATTHWVYQDYFRLHYPKVKLRLDKTICFSSAGAGVITTGGTTSWQELALFLITNYVDQEHAVRAAKFWLLNDKGPQQTPFAAMPLAAPHGDAAIERAQAWLADNYAAEYPVQAVTERSNLPPTSFARRFKRATGYPPLDYVHAIRVEEAKQLLETTEQTVEEIGRHVGYEDAASFRRLFRRRTGQSPAEHRKMFGNVRFARYR